VKTFLRAPVALLATLIVALLATPCGAQDTDSAARRAFRLGEANYQNGEFAEAGRLFEEAHRLSGRARLLYNAYVAYRDAQDMANSARVLRMFLTESTDLEASERDQLTARLAAIERVLAQGGGGSTTAGATTTSSTGATTSSGSGTTTTPRETTTTTTTSTTPTSTSTSTDTSSSSTAAARDTSTSSSTTTASASAESSGGGFNPSPVGFIVGGVGVAMVVAGIVTGVMASGHASTLSSMCPDGICSEDLRDERDEGQSLAIATDVLLIGGLVAVAAGTTLIFVLQDSPSEASVSASAMCTGDGCYGSVGGRF
jgi:hypothetical protein